MSQINDNKKYITKLILDILNSNSTMLKKHLIEDSSKQIVNETVNSIPFQDELNSFFFAGIYNGDLNILGDLTCHNLTIDGIDITHFQSLLDSLNGSEQFQRLLNNNINIPSTLTLDDLSSNFLEISEVNLSTQVSNLKRNETNPGLNNKNNNNVGYIAVDYIRNRGPDDLLINTYDRGFLGDFYGKSVIRTTNDTSFNKGELHIESSDLLYLQFISDLNDGFIIYDTNKINYIKLSSVIGLKTINLGMIGENIYFNFQSGIFNLNASNIVEINSSIHINLLIDNNSIIKIQNSIDDVYLKEHAQITFRHESNGPNQNLIIKQTGSSNSHFDLLSDGNIQIRSLKSTKINANDSSYFKVTNNETNIGQRCDLELNLNVTQINPNSSLIIKSSSTASDSIKIYNYNIINSNTVTGGIDIDAGNKGIDILATGGPISIDAQYASSNFSLATNDNGQDLTISVTGNTNSSLILESSGTKADAVQINATNGGIDISASGASAGEDIDITATGSSVNITSTENVNDAITLNATTGGIDISASGASAGEDIDITATGSSVNITSTENVNDAITLNATTGGINLNSNTNSIDMLSVDGPIYINAQNHSSNFSLDTNADGQDLTIQVTGISDSSLILSSEGTGIDAILLHAISGGIDIQTLHNIYIDSSNGMINIGTDNNIGDINIGTNAGARTITIGNDASSKVDINAIDIELDSAGIIVLDSTTTTDIQAIGNITIDSSGGNIGIGTDNDIGDINIGTNSDLRTINIGTGNAIKTINIATDNIPINQIIIGGFNSDTNINGNFQLNSVLVSTTAEELNTLDISTNTQFINIPNAIILTSTLVTLDSSGGPFAITLATPTSAQYGKTMIIQMITAGNDVTLDLTTAPIIGGTGLLSAKWDAINEILVLLGVQNNWLIMKEQGVTLS